MTTETTPSPLTLKDLKPLAERTDELLANAEQTPNLDSQSADVKRWCGVDIRWGSDLDQIELDQVRNKAAPQ